MWENMDQKNSEYGHFLSNEHLQYDWLKNSGCIELKFNIANLLNEINLLMLFLETEPKLCKCSFGK